MPLTEADAREMLDGIKAAAGPGRHSGAPPVDREALVGLLLRISELVTAFPEIAELDLNPVLALPSALNVLDVVLCSCRKAAQWMDRKTAPDETIVSN